MGPQIFSLTLMQCMFWLRYMKAIQLHRYVVGKGGTCTFLKGPWRGPRDRLTPLSELLL